MTVNHAAVAALPISSAADQTLLRNAITSRIPYVVTSAADAANLVTVDATTGAVVTDLVLFGRVFHYDSTDTTTAHDGTSCLVSASGGRYKLALGTDVFAYAVLSNSLTAPPASPTLGDSYLVAAAATGAWSGKDNQVAVYTARGWEFVNFGIGRLIYVESVESYYHKTSLGVWTVGFGNLALGSKTVPFSAAINFGARFIVENQTTTAPPVSPTVGTAYVIGASATGAWSGQDLRIAVCEVAGSFTIYTPSNGWSAYDKSLNASFTFNGSTWQSSAGTWIARLAVQTTSGSTTAPTGSSAYSTYSSGTAPTTSQRRLIDTVTLGYTAKKTSAVLRFHYSGDVILTAGAGGTGNVVVALFRDSGSNAIDWQIVPLASLIPISTVAPTHLDHWFEVTAPDTSAHTYTIAIMSSGTNSGAAIEASALTRRTFEVEEAA